MSKIDPRTAYSPASATVSVRLYPCRWSNAIRLSRAISIPGLSSRTFSRTRNGVTTRCNAALIVVTSSCGPAGAACNR